MTRKINKKNVFKRLAKNNSGIIIYVVLWVVVVLTSLALSLGRSSHIQLALANHALGKAKSLYLAQAAVSWAASKINESSKDPSTQESDSLLYCGIKGDKFKNTENFFKDQKLEAGKFSIGYLLSLPDDKIKKRIYALYDQERLININAFTAEQQNVLVSLLTSLGVKEETSKEITAAILDWRDVDPIVSGTDLGAEDAYYMSLRSPYHCKNRPFDAKEELLLVKSVTLEIYNLIKDFITIYPKEGNLQVNFDTAPKEVLLALSRSASGPATNTQISDADSLVNKILDFRQGDDGHIATDDDRSIDFSQIGLNEKEQVIALVINQYRTKLSRYLTIFAKGFDTSSGVSSEIQAIIQKDDLQVVSWQRK